MKQGQCAKITDFAKAIFKEAKIDLWSSNFRTAKNTKETVQRKIDSFDPYSYYYDLSERKKIAQDLGMDYVSVFEAGLAIGVKGDRHFIITEDGKLVPGLPEEGVQYIARGDKGYGLALFVVGYETWVLNQKGERLYRDFPDYYFTFLPDNLAVITNPQPVIQLYYLFDLQQGKIISQGFRSLGDDDSGEKHYFDGRKLMEASDEDHNLCFINQKGEVVLKLGQEYGPDREENYKYNFTTGTISVFDHLHSKCFDETGRELTQEEIFEKREAFPDLMVWCGESNADGKINYLFDDFGIIKIFPDMEVRSLDGTYGTHDHLLVGRRKRFSAIKIALKKGNSVTDHFLLNRQGEIISDQPINGYEGIREIDFGRHARAIKLKNEGCCWLVGLDLKPIFGSPEDGFEDITPLAEELFLVEKNGEKIIVNHDMTPLAFDDYKEGTAIGNFCDGLALVTTQKGYFYIDKIGRRVIPQNASEYCQKANWFFKGRAKIRTADREYIIDTTGQKITSRDYDEIGNRYGYSWGKTGKKYFILNEDCSEQKYQNPAGYDSFEPLSDKSDEHSFYRVSLGADQFVIDHEGRPISGPYERFHQYYFDDNPSLYSLNDDREDHTITNAAWALNENFREIANPKPFRGLLGFGRRQNLWYLVGEQGEIETDGFDGIIDQSENRLLVLKNNRYFFLDENFRNLPEADPEGYVSANGFYQGISLVEDSAGQIYFIDRAGCKIFND